MCSRHLDFVFDLGFGDEEAERQNLRGSIESGVHALQSLKTPDHEA